MAQMQLREIQPIPTRVTAEYGGRVEAIAEPSPSLTVAACCPGRQPCEPVRTPRH
jgi:hypothetical protein